MVSKNPSYRKHLEDRKRRTLIANGAVLESALSNKLLKIVFLDQPEGVSEVGDALAAGWPVLIDFGATYATAFLDAVRSDVGRARLESPPFVPVSLVSCITDALQWIDFDKLHPTVREAIQEGIFSKLEQVLFIRVPANASGRKLGEHCISEQGEIQLYFFPESDPLLTYMTYKYRHLLTVDSVLDSTSRSQHKTGSNSPWMHLFDHTRFMLVPKRSVFR